MEINDFGELNALNKLLGKVKFSDDIDFYEFKEFVGSPLVANIYKRIFEQYISECKKQGRLAEDFSADFKFESTAGKALRKRIDELTDLDKETIEKHNSVDTYLQTLLAPLNCNEVEYQLLKQYYKDSPSASASL